MTLAVRPGGDPVCLGKLTTISNTWQPISKKTLVFSRDADRGRRHPGAARVHRLGARHRTGAPRDRDHRAADPDRDRDRDSQGSASRRRHRRRPSSARRWKSRRAIPSWRFRQAVTTTAITQHDHQAGRSSRRRPSGRQEPAEDRARASPTPKTSIRPPPSASTRKAWPTVHVCVGPNGKLTEAPTLAQELGQPAPRRGAPSSWRRPASRALSAGHRRRQAGRCLL